VNFDNRYLTKSGAWRCIRWNASSDRKHIYAVGSDVTDLKAIQAERAELLAKVELIARTDDLTGLPNRRAWEEELRREMSRTLRNGHPLYLLMLDIDRFKQYNDACAHRAGDALQQAAISWRIAIRDSDSSHATAARSSPSCSRTPNQTTRWPASSSDFVKQSQQGKPVRQVWCCGTSRSRQKHSSPAPMQPSTKPSEPDATA
jgi:hypothetical protein